MCKVLLGILALSCTVFLVPFSAAAQSTVGSERLCAKVFDTLDLQNPKLKIDLLEDGVVPGFTSIPQIDNAQLMDSVAQYQAVNGLPVTGCLDNRTLAKLNISEPKLDPASAAVERAKPSK